MLNDQGETVARYRKLHLFDIDIKGQTVVKESDFTIHGDALQPPVQTVVGKVGLSTVNFKILGSWTMNVSDRFFLVLRCSISGTSSTSKKSRSRDFDVSVGVYVDDGIGALGGKIFGDSD